MTTSLRSHRRRSARSSPRLSSAWRALTALVACSLVWVPAGVSPVARAAEGPPAGTLPRKKPKSRRAKSPTPPAVTIPKSPELEACVNHHTEAQELRMAGKLLESRVALRQCAAEQCPALLQRDCVGWIDQLEAQIPSLTFRVTVDGQSRTEGQLYVDDRLRPELASGKAIELDPGKHRVRFVLEGVSPYEEEVISSEGERYRMLEVALFSMATPTRAETQRAETHRPVPLGTYVLGGVAVAAAVSGGIWGAASLSLRHELEDTCAPACPERRVDELRQRALITDLSWGVSALALVGATTLFVFRPELTVEADVTWVPGGGMGHLRFDAF
jgi:hypothetical protein